MTTVININQAPPGWRSNPAYVYIGRPSLFQNPFLVGNDRDLCIQHFTVYFHHRLSRDADFRAAVLALRGRTLVCFCSPLACHGNVIAAWLNSQPQ